MAELNDILERLRASLGALGDGPHELTGGITNRNFRVTLGGGEYVVRRPGRDTELLGIDRQAERIASETAARLGIAPAVAAALDDCLVTEFIDCVPLEPGEPADRAEELALALRAMHDSRVQLPTCFRVSELLKSYAAVVDARGARLPAAYAPTAALVARIEAALAPALQRPCHNDLLPGNIIRARDGGRLMLVDWEYAAIGDPRFDLGNLSINNGFDEAADERLLRAYHGAPPADAQRASLRLARLLSDAREGAWGVVQGVVSALDFDFDGYAREHFGRLEALGEAGELENWLAAAAGRAGDGARA